MARALAGKRRQLPTSPHHYSLVHTTGKEQVLGSTVLVSTIQSLQPSAETTGEEIPRGARPTAWAPRTSATTLTAPRAQQGGWTKLAVSCQCSGDKPQRSHPPGLVTHRTKPKPSVPAHSRLLPAWGPACPELSRLSKDHLIVVYETSHCADAGGGNGVPHRLVIPTDVTSPPCCAAQWGPGCACFSQGDLSQTCNDFPGKSPALLPLHSHPMLEPANGFPKELTCSRVLCPGQPRRDESLIFGKCCKFTWMGRECRITLAPSFPPSLYASRLAPLNSLLLLAINCTWWKVTPQSNFSKKCS